MTCYYLINGKWYTRDSAINKLKDGMLENVSKEINIPSLNKYIEENKISTEEVQQEAKPIEEVKPIRQLGTGANVYFETDKYRVNDSDGKVLLNIQNKTDVVPVANIEFDNAKDAVAIAERISKDFPEGVPDALLVDKYVENLKKELLGEKVQQDVAQKESWMIPTYEGQTKQTNIKLIPTEQLDLVKDQDRETKPKWGEGDTSLDKLTNQIKQDGKIKTPIQVDHFREGYIITEGNTRLAVAKRLGIKEIPVVINERNKSSEGTIYEGKVKEIIFNTKETTSKLDIIKALKENKYQDAISKKQMTAEEAKNVIESAGLEVPKDILELSKGETKVEEETKNEPIGKERIEEHQGDVQGQQEEGKSTGGERQEAVTETDTGDRAERSGKKEKEQALASVNSITASFKVPDITAEQQKAAQDKLVEHINEQSKRFKHVSPQLTKYLTEEAAKVNAKNVDKKIAYINKVLDNSEFASKVEEANTERKKVDLNRIKNESSKFDWLKDIVFNKRFKNRGQKITTWLNKIELSELGTNTDMVNDYINVLKGLNRKGIPDFAPLKDFAIRYRDVVQKSIDLNSVEVPASEFTADNLLNKAKELTTKIDELLSRDDVDAQEIVNVKRQAGSLASAIKTLVQNGDVRVEGEDFYIQNPEVAKLDSFLETSGKFSEKTREDIKKVEEQYKTKTLSDVSKNIKDNKLQEQAITEQDAMLLDNIQKLSEMLKDDKVAQNALSVYDMDYLQKGVEQVGTSGVLPTKLYKLGENLAKARMYSEIKPVLDNIRMRRALMGVFAGKKDMLTIDFLKKSPEDQLKEFMISPDWDKGSIQGLVEKIGKTRYDAYYDKVSSPIREQIVLIENEMNRIEREMNDMVIKTYERGKVRQAWDYLFGVNDRNLQAKVTSARVGILMANLRFYHWMNGDRPILQEGDKFKVVNINGERIQDNGKDREFTSIDEARQWVKDNKTEIIGEDNLDFYNLVTRGLMKEKAKSAKLGDKVTTKEKKMVFEKAYDLLTNNGKDKLVITSDQEALAKLTPVEQELYKHIRSIYENHFDKLSAVAAREGKALNKEPYYYPMFSRNDYNDFQDKAEFLKEDIFNKTFDKGMPEVIGSIHPKTNAINYIDFDAYRTTKNWVNDLMISDKLLPVIRQQVGAINQVIKDYRSDKNLTREQQEDMASYLRNVKEDIKTGVVAEYTRSRMFGEVGHNRFINTGKLLSEMSTFGKKILVSTGLRAALDGVPNTLNFGVYTIGKGTKIGKQANYWDDFFNLQQGTLAAKKREEFQNKMAMGTYEQKSIQKGKIAELTEKNIAIGDKITSGVAWIAKFEQAYKDLTGKEFDVEKYTTDEAYREKVDENDKFRSAMRMADREIERILVPQTAYSNKVLLGRMLSGVESARKGGGLWNWSVPLSMFAMNQSRRLFSDLRDIRYNSNQGRSRAAYDVSKILAGELAYNMITQVGVAGSLYVASTLTDDEDKQKKAHEMFANTFTDPKSYYFALLGSAGSLLTSGYGNLARTMLGVGAVTGKQMVLDAQTAPEKHRLQHELDKYNRLASRMINTNVGLMSKDLTFGDYLTVGLPVTGYGIARIGEGFNYGLIEPVSKLSKGEDVNWAHAVNGAHAIFALRNTLPISKDIDRITKNMAMEFGDSQLPEDLLKTHLTYSYFTMLHNEAKQLFDDAVKKKLNDPNEKSGDDVLKEYLDNDNGNYRKMFDYYNINKPYFRMIEEAYSGVSKSKSLTIEERKQLIEDLKNESVRLQDHYDNYEKSGKGIEYQPDKLMEIYEKIKLDYAKSLMKMSEDENNYWSVHKGKSLNDALNKENK